MFPGLTGEGHCEVKLGRAWSISGISPVSGSRSLSESVSLLYVCKRQVFPVIGVPPQKDSPPLVMPCLGHQVCLLFLWGFGLLTLCREATFPCALGLVHAIGCQSFVSVGLLVHVSRVSGWVRDCKSRSALPQPLLFLHPSAGPQGADGGVAQPGQ